MMRKTKQLDMDQGIVSSSNAKPGKNLNKITVGLVQNSYNCDEASSNMCM
jgi:hypothetical protein